MEKVLSLSQIEERVKKNSIKYKVAIDSFVESVNKQKKNQGRVRPKHPTEKKILSLFHRK